jgi:hypothetical protein
MNEFRLNAWPDLPSGFDRIGYSRALSQLSHRYLTLEELTKASGLTRQQSQDLLDLVDDQGCLAQRAVPGMHLPSSFVHRAVQRVAEVIGWVPEWRGKGTVQRIRIDPRS